MKNFNLSNLVLVTLEICLTLITIGCSKENANEEYPTEGNIKFQDEVAKIRFVERFDKDSDNELSFAEAAAVSSLKLDIEFTTGIENLDDLKYFTGLASFDLFWGLANYHNGKSYLSILRKIAIPKNVRILKDFGPLSNYKLEKITFYPETPPSNFYYVFDDANTKVQAEIWVPKESLSLYRDALQNAYNKLHNARDREGEPTSFLYNKDIDELLSRIHGF